MCVSANNVVLISSSNICVFLYHCSSCCVVFEIFVIFSYLRNPVNFFHIFKSSLPCYYFTEFGVKFYVDIKILYISIFIFCFVVVISTREGLKLFLSLENSKYTVKIIFSKKLFKKKPQDSKASNL